MTPSFRTFINNTRQDLGRAWDGFTNAANEIYTGFTKPHPGLPRSDIFKGSLQNAANGFLNIPQGVGQVATDFNNFIPDTLNMGIDFANSFYPNRDRFKRLPKFDNAQWGRQYVQGAHPASAAGGVIAGGFLTPGAVAKATNIHKYINKAQNIGRRVKNRWHEIERWRGLTESPRAKPVAVPANPKSPSGYNINLDKALGDHTFYFDQMRGPTGYPNIEFILDGMGLNPEDYRIKGFLQGEPRIKDSTKSTANNFSLRDGFWYRKQRLDNYLSRRRLSPPPLVSDEKPIRSWKDIDPDLDERRLSREYYGNRSGRNSQGPLFFGRTSYVDHYGDPLPQFPQDGLVTTPAIVASDKYLVKGPGRRVLVTPDLLGEDGSYAVDRMERLRNTNRKSINGVPYSEYMRSNNGIYRQEATRPSGKGVDASDITDLLVPFKLEGKDTLNTMHLVRSGSPSGVLAEQYVHPVVNRTLGSSTFPNVLSNGKSRITSPEMWIHNMLNRNKPRLTPNSTVSEFDVPVR